MIFADVRGFTAMVNERGPEETTKLVNEFFKRSREIVVNHDGIVDKVMGDAVMAYFNVPVRQDDHMAQAVSVATAIQLAAGRIRSQNGDGEPLRVGIGIGSGMIYAELMGSDDCRDYTIIGEAVNLAARLQDQAAPGEVLVAENVYDSVKGAFPHAQERVLEIKGFSTPITAYSLT